MDPKKLKIGDYSRIKKSNNEIIEGWITDISPATITLTHPAKGTTAINISDISSLIFRPTKGCRSCSKK